MSRALNNHAAINVETRKTIQEYAERMGYQRNTVSLSLLHKSTKTIGIILPNISQFHESSMVEGLQAILQPLGYLLNICVTNEHFQLEKEYTERLLANRVDGIFISISQETYNEGRYEHLQMAYHRNIPLIFIDRKYDEIEADGVTTDDYHGAFIATQHLIEVGCKRIAHLRGPKGLTVSEQRFNGYKDCLAKHNLAIDENLIRYADFKVESAIEPTRYFLDLQNPPDGIFGVNDQVCFGALKVIRERSIKVPEQIAIIGFDNSPISEYFYPPLSTVGRKSQPIGEEAAKLFLKQISAPSVTSNIVLSPELIIRQSSKR